MHGIKINGALTCCGFALVLVLLGALVLGSNVSAQSSPNLRDASRNEPLPKVRPIPPEIRQYFKLPAFYKKYTHVYGFPVAASDKPSDFALLEAAYLIRNMIGHRPDILRTLGTNRSHYAVISASGFPSDLPELRRSTPAENEYLDKRGRAYGGNGGAFGGNGAEENLLKLKGDAWAGESILIHEFAHTVHAGIKRMDSTFQQRLKQAYETAKAAGLWKRTYAGTNPAEYWAEAVQDWFDCNAQGADGIHNHVNTREELKQYDPALAKLVGEVFGERDWRYQMPQDRFDAGHLNGFERGSVVGYDTKSLAKRYPNPKYKWRDGSLVETEPKAALSSPPQPK